MKRSHNIGTYLSSRETVAGFFYLAFQMLFLPPMLLSGEAVTLTGAPSLMRRPMDVYSDFCKKQSDIAKITCRKHTSQYTTLKASNICNCG